MSLNSNIDFSKTYEDNDPEATASKVFQIPADNDDDNNYTLVKWDIVTIVGK